MCGIVGFSKLNHSIRNDQELIIKGLSSLKHRGPDEAGFYTDDKITLGHARLAIVSPDHGKQPFSASGRAEILVYNGEIFNHEELTKLLNLNGVFLDNYGSEVLRLRIKEPLVLAEEVAKKVDVAVSVRGGGANGQADAIRLAIARALVEHDRKLKSVFDGYDRLLLVADVRRKEVCKPNVSKARKKRQKSYR